ncbi:MAG: hypothetical protein D3908_04265, partial [Candidatus Electrothrix sp. AUS4]|nr:hypothetical protein [Candidatus Electrothrix sp. AUS4]
MKIKTILQLHISLAVLFGIIFFLILYISLNTSGTTLVLERQLYSIELDAQQLILLSYELRRGNTKKKRLKEQWQTIYSRLNKSLTEISQRDEVPDIHTRLRQLKYNHAHLGKLYYQLLNQPALDHSAEVSE